MGENCHNCGRVCWNSLADTLKYKTHQDINGTLKYSWSADKKKIHHFAKVLTKTIADYSSTWNKPRNNDLDPTTWPYGDRMYSAGAFICNLDTLVSVYVQLNLILLDRAYLNTTPLLRSNWVYDMCEGCGDGGHEDYMANEFSRVRGKLFKLTHKGKYSQQNIYDIVLTDETVNLTRKYLDKVFECLIRYYQKCPEHFEESSIVSILEWCLYLYW